MSRRSSEGGRKKSLLDPRRHVKCPVSECIFSRRIDHVKKHFNKLIVWSKTYEGEELEIEFISPSMDTNSIEKQISSVLNFFPVSSMNNKERPGSAETYGMKYYKYGMKVIVETLASDKVKTFFGE